LESFFFRRISFVWLLGTHLLFEPLYQWLLEIGSVLNPPPGGTSWQQCLIITTYSSEGRQDLVGFLK
jgi:hypothetical protein